MNGLEKGAVLFTGVVAVGAVSMSVSGLVKVADMAHFPKVHINGLDIPVGAIGLICCLDGAALAAGLMRRARKMWEATVLMASAVVVSMVAQAVAEFVVPPAAVPGAVETPPLFAALVHTLGPAFAWGLTEALLIFLRGEPGNEAESEPVRGQSGTRTTKEPITRSARTAAGTTSPKPPASPAQAEVSASGTHLSGATAEAERKGEGRSVPTAPPPPSLTLVPDAKPGDMELVAQMSDWLKPHGIVDPSRTDVQDVIQDATGRRPGGERAERLRRLYRYHHLTPLSTSEGQG